LLELQVSPKSQHEPLGHCDLIGQHAPVLLHECDVGQQMLLQTVAVSQHWLLMQLAVPDWQQAPLHALPLAQHAPLPSQ
jgi:hypothetical protein